MAQVPDLLTVEEAAEVLRIGRTMASQLAQASARRPSAPSTDPSTSTVALPSMGQGRSRHNPRRTAVLASPTRQ